MRSLRDGGPDAWIVGLDIFVLDTWFPAEEDHEHVERTTRSGSPADARLQRGIGVLVMVWLEVSRLRREAARLRHHLAEKWRIYVRATAAFDVQMQGHVVDAAEKAQN